MQKIGVLGRGTMSSGIAQIIAQKDIDVVMWVRSIDENDPRGSLKHIVRGLSRQVEKGRMTQEEMDKIKERFLEI